MAEAPTFAAARRTFYLLGSAALLIAGLYWGQRILIPLALAILLTFSWPCPFPVWSAAASGESRHPK